MMSKEDVAKAHLQRSVACKNFKVASSSFLLRSIGSLSSPHKITCVKSWLEGEERPGSFFKLAATGNFHCNVKI